MRFPPSFIERLRSHFLISEVIARRMTLKKHGREHQGLCPFHNEKSPSFTVNDEKGFFHCFGCGAHGDAIEFIRRHERLSYPETIETLAREAGIALPEIGREETRRAQVEKTLYDVLEAACQWFERQLSESTGQTARDYLEKRGLKPETLRLFRAGFAPDDRSALYNHLLKAGFAQPLQAEAGLIIRPEQGVPYDRFRGRIMFPIRNASGKVVAFGGRLLGANAPGKSLPKYLNSPETPLFEKGKLLYNLDLAKKAARDGSGIVVMEGYMDVIASWQAGVHYAVATLGTAVTPEHLRLLWQLAKEPVMCLDGDDAGKRAMLRATDIALPLLKPTFSLRFAELPKGEDPDSYVQKHGAKSFGDILLRARRLLDVMWEEQKRLHNPSISGGLAALEDACRKLTDKIADATVKRDYWSHFSGHISYCHKQVWKENGKPAKNLQPRSREVEHLAARHHLAALDTLIERLLSLLLRFPGLLHKSRIEENLSRLDIRQLGCDAARNALLAAHAQGHDSDDAFLASIRAQLPEELLTAIGKQSTPLPYAESLTEDAAAARWQETLSAYQVAHLELELIELQESIARNMTEADYQRLAELKQELWKAQHKRTFARAEADMV